MSVLHSIYREECVAAGCVERYDALIKAGNSPGFAVMLAMRQPPGARGTERAFLEGDTIHHGLQHLPESMQMFHIAKARLAGINPTGKVYKSGLADNRGPGDPAAWVSSNEDVIAACRAKNRNCSGAINYQADELPPKPDVPLHPSLVAEFAQQEIAKDPRWKNKPQELREKVIAEHGPACRSKKARLKPEQIAKLDAVPLPD